MRPTSSDRQGTSFEVNEATSLEDSPLDVLEGGLEQGEDVEEAGRFGGARRVGSFVTSKFVELKTGTQDAIGNFGETVSEKVKKHPKIVAGMTAAAVLLGGATQQASGETNAVNEKAAIERTSATGGVKFSGDAEAAPQNRALSTKAIDACLKRAVHRPDYVRGIVRKDGKMSTIGASYSNDFNNIDCRINSEKTIKTWIEMQKNNGKFVRNSKVLTGILRDEGTLFIDRNYQLNRRYTCMAGPKQRGIRFATHVTGTYEGKSLSRSYRAGGIIATPKVAGFIGVGKIKC